MLTKMIKPRIANIIAKRMLMHKSPLPYSMATTRSFSHGPYNPLHYKTVLVPEEAPSTEDYYANVKSIHSEPPPPMFDENRQKNKPFLLNYYEAKTP